MAERLVTGSECPKCYAQQAVVRCDQFDAYACLKCDVWLETGCSDTECHFCVDRPEKPSEAHVPSSIVATAYDFLDAGYWPQETLSSDSPDRVILTGKSFLVGDSREGRDHLNQIWGAMVAIQAERAKKGA